MKKIFTVILVALAFAFSAKAATLSSLTWANVCSGGMGDDWYGTEKWKEYEKAFAEAGIRIVYFPYTHGISSTKITEALAAVRDK